MVLLLEVCARLELGRRTAKIGRAAARGAYALFPCPLAVSRRIAGTLSYKVN